jgi:hypothetical protein
MGLLILGSISCATHRVAERQARGFGAVDPAAPALSPEMLRLVSQEMELGEIFRILGPAHADFTPFQGGPCWEWRFTNGDVLVIPIDSNPQTKPRSFSVWMVDGVA